MVLQEQLIAEVRQMQGHLFSTSAAEQEFITDDQADPSRKMIRRILGAVNEYERDMIALRLRSGRRRSALRTVTRVRLTSVRAAREGWRTGHRRERASGHREDAGAVGGRALYPPDRR